MNEFTKQLRLYFSAPVGIELAVNASCVVSMGSGLQGLLFSYITKQHEGDSFKLSCSNGAYCAATLLS